MICLIDNYDSFTYNLYQYIGELNPDIVVRRNDEIELKEIEAMDPSHIIISPGPGHPAMAGICVALVRKFTGQIPILGICLGHQAIGLAMGGKIDYAQKIVHGKASEVFHGGKGIFKGIPPSFMAGRYHSLVIRREGLPDCLEIHSETKDGIIMAVAHKNHSTFGLQFHPESILTEYGKKVLANFLEIRRNVS